MNSSKMKLTADVLRSFKVSKVFREHKEKVNSIDYSFNGETMVSSSNDDTMIVYCCMEGKPRRYVNSKKYGCDLVRCTHSPNAVLCTSNKVDDTIRYLSLHDNKYLRYFPGHTKKVVSLQVSPVNDMFISCSLDKTVRLWDLRSINCQGIMHLNGRPVAGFDPEGLIFAAGIDSRVLKLYDLKSFDKGPFATFNIRLDMPGMEWTGVKFSADGKCILLSTNANQIILMDAFSGNELHRLTGYHNIKGLSLEASFTPDSQFVLSGSDDGMVYAWSVDSGEQVATLDGGHPGPTTSVQFNPRFMTLASACTNVGFWLPGAEE